MKKLKLVIIGACVAAFSVFGLGGSASAWNCRGLDNSDLKLSPACEAAAWVICKAVAQGEPCLG